MDTTAPPPKLTVKKKKSKQFFDFKLNVKFETKKKSKKEIKNAKNFKTNKKILPLLCSTDICYVGRTTIR
jgi:hypothetical protein